MNRILFATISVAIIIIATTLIPTVKGSEEDVDEYIPNTVVIEDSFQSYVKSLNEKAEKQMVYSVDDCSCTLNTTAYEMFGEQEYDDIPIDLTLSDNGISTDYVQEVPENVIKTDSESIYDIIYDENGNIYDIIITVDNQDYSARELYDPIDNCFVSEVCVGSYITYTTVCTTVAVSTGWIPFIGWLIAIVMVIIVVAIVCYYYYETHHACTEDGIIHYDYTNKVVDGIELGYDNNNPIPKCISIYGTDYAFNSRYINDTANKNNNNYYFAYLIDHQVYIFPKTTTKTTAYSVIIHNRTECNVFTFYGSNASEIAGPSPIFHSAHNEGEYPHYHYGFYVGSVLKKGNSHSLFMY